MEEKTLKINWCKPGGTASKNASPTAKISLPTAWIHEIGITKDDAEISMSLDGDQIVIKKIVQK